MSKKGEFPKKRLWLRFSFTIKMTALEMIFSKMNSNSSSLRKMNNQTISELKAIAKERGLRGYYPLKRQILFLY